MDSEIRKRLWEKIDYFNSEFSKNNQVDGIFSLKKIIDAYRKKLKKEIEELVPDIGQKSKHNMGIGMYFRGVSKESFQLIPSIGRQKKER